MIYPLTIHGDLACRCHTRHYYILNSGEPDGRVTRVSEKRNSHNSSLKVFHYKSIVSDQFCSITGSLKKFDILKDPDSPPFDFEPVFTEKFHCLRVNPVLFMKDTFGKEVFIVIWKDRHAFLEDDRP